MKWLAYLTINLRDLIMYLKKIRPTVLSGDKIYTVTTNAFPVLPGRQFRILTYKEGNQGPTNLDIC